MVLATSAFLKKKTKTAWFHSTKFKQAVIYNIRPQIFQCALNNDWITAELEPFKHSKRKSCDSCGHCIRDDSFKYHLSPLTLRWPECQSDISKMPWKRAWTFGVRGTQLSLEQVFPFVGWGVILPSQGHLATPGNSFDCHNWGKWQRYWHLLSRDQWSRLDAAKFPRVQGAVLVAVATV